MLEMAVAKGAPMRVGCVRGEGQREQDNRGKATHRERCSKVEDGRGASVGTEVRRSICSKESVL